MGNKVLHTYNDYAIILLHSDYIVMLKMTTQNPCAAFACEEEPDNRTAEIVFTGGIESFFEFAKKERNRKAYHPLMFYRALLEYDVLCCTHYEDDFRCYTV